MKLLILSDSHGDSAALMTALEANTDAQAVIFLGDGMRDVEWLEDAYPHTRIYAVRGNCDMMSFAPTEGLAPFGGSLVFYTHGHLYGVKSGPYELADAAKARGADIALYGHTHCRALEQVDGVWLFNPGALSYTRGEGGSSYGVLTLEPGSAPVFAHRTL